MQLTVNVKKQIEVEFLQVEAEVRYWEDATVNGVQDDEGSLIPLRRGDLWCPVIRLRDGQIMEWPAGVVASIHYKVCDQGQYWLWDAAGSRVAEYNGDYVPDSFLCHGDRGYGDYIIFDVGGDGMIQGWAKPKPDPDDWDLL